MKAKIAEGYLMGYINLSSFTHAYHSQLADNKIARST